MKGRHVKNKYIHCKWCNIYECIFIIMLILSECYSQSTNTVVISDIVGDTIDCVENETYMLFPDISNYKHAVFIIGHDSTLSAIVTVADDGVLHDTVIHLRRYATSISNQIEALFEQKYGVSRNDTLARQDVAYSAKKGGIFKITITGRRSIIGELMSIREHAIIIAMGAEGWRRMPNTYHKLIAIQKDSICAVCIHKNIQTSGYITFGAIAGLIVGLIMPVPIDEYGHEMTRTWWPVWISLFPIIGVIIGYFIANNIEEYDECKRYNTEECRSWFAQYARYQHGEPPYLKQIMP
jgi:hypothetical protein